MVQKRTNHVMIVKPHKIPTKSETYWKLLVCFPSPYTVNGSFRKACKTNLGHAKAIEILQFSKKEKKIYLSNKIADNTTVINKHSWSIGIKDTSNPNLSCINNA